MDDRDLKIKELGDEFADAVVTLFEDAQKRSSLEKNAREAAVRQFSYETGRSELDEIYRQLIETRESQLRSSGPSAEIVDMSLR